MKHEESRPLGKSELAAALKWSRSRLDRRLDQDPHFPVKKRGTRSGGWEFDLSAVLAYLGQPAAATTKRASPSAGAHAPRTRDAGTARAPAAPDQAEQGDDGAPLGAGHHGEMTAAQRLKNAQAAREEDKLRLARRELVEAEEMRMVLGTMLARLGKGLDGLPDTLRRHLNLPEEAGEVMRGLVDELRRNMVADLQTLLA